MIKHTCQFIVEREPGRLDGKLRFRVKRNHNRDIVSFGPCCSTDIHGLGGDAEESSPSSISATSLSRKDLHSGEVDYIQRLKEEIWIDPNE